MVLLFEISAVMLLKWLVVFGKGGDIWPKVEALSANSRLKLLTVTLLFLI